MKYGLCLHLWIECNEISCFIELVNLHLSFIFMWWTAWWTLGFCENIITFYLFYIFVCVFIFFILFFCIYSFLHNTAKVTLYSLDSVFCDGKLTLWLHWLFVSSFFLYKIKTLLYFCIPFPCAINFLLSTISSLPLSES